MTTEAVCELNDFHSNSPSSFGYFNRFSIRPSTSLEEVQICMPCNTEDRFVTRMSPTFHQSRKQKKSRRGTANGRIRENYYSLFRLQTAEEDLESLSASSTESLNSLTNFPLRANSRSDDKFRRAVSEQVSQFFSWEVGRRKNRNVSFEKWLDVVFDFRKGKPYFWGW